MYTYNSYIEREINHSNINHLFYSPVPFVGEYLLILQKNLSLHNTLLIPLRRYERAEK